MATGDPAGWMGRLPHVLLGIRTAQRPDVGFSPAECLYGTDLVLPGQLAPVIPLPDSTALLQDFTARLKADMATATYRETAWHTADRRPRIPAALAEAEFVFVRHGARRTPLSWPYDDPYRVKKKGDKYFGLQAGTKEQVISVDRLKPAFGFADPTPTTSKAPTAVQKPAPRQESPGPSIQKPKSSPRP